MSEYSNNNVIKYLNLRNNPGCESLLQEEVYLSDAQSLLAAWRAFKKAEFDNALIPLNTAKLIIVGEEAVGKTSLVNFLIHDRPCDPNEPKTPGINLTDQIETSHWHPDGSDIKLNIWDFGGQEIMHGTHRYFLTERSVYLLVLEDRREDNPPVERWMKIIRSYAGASPVVVVINKSDEGKAALKLDQNELSRKFPQITDYFRTSCQGGTWSENSIKMLRNHISGVLNTHEELEPIRGRVPIEWNAVKQSIGKRAGDKRILEHQEFSDICIDAKIIKDRPIKDAATQTALLRLLHELGVIVAHGLKKDEATHLPDITLLDPNWLTGAIYSVLNAAKLQETGGVFTPADLSNWLDTNTYPKQHHDFIISMMRNPDIELCYRLPGETDTFLAPDALPKNTPDYTGFMDGSLRFRYRYTHLPTNVIPRFLVKAQDCIPKDRPIWRSGGKLKSHGCDIIVKSDRDSRVIDIAIKGDRPREALAVIRQHFSAVHDQFEDLEVRRIVPMPDDPDIEEDYDHLLQLEQEEGRDYKHRPTRAKRSYPVSELLDNITLNRRVSSQPAPLSTPSSIQSSLFNKFATPQNLFALLFGALTGLSMKTNFGQSLTLSALIGLVMAACAFGVTRMFDRAFMFRRLFSMWVVAGLLVVSIWFISGAINTDWITVEFNNQTGIVSGTIWAIGFVGLAILAYREAKA